ncbi:acetate--CoA ligase family protein [candidate division KSB1 bacterium]|nr:acetate--CoA ligase family protein [candidate division KSB1 bacterium]
MARLFEHQGKTLLKEKGIPIPKGMIANSPSEARRAAEQIGCPVVIKAQVWSTSRAASGGIAFADSPHDTEKQAEKILGQKIGQFVVETVLVEEELSIRQEFYASILIHDRVPGPVLLFNVQGGSGVEDQAGALSMDIDVIKGLCPSEAADLLQKAGISDSLQSKLSDLLVRLYQTARVHEARSAEINPIILTTDGELYAADCRIAIDDYAVFRHPELGIEIARELSNPPTQLDKIAHDVEFHDYRGTFYFIQLEQDFHKGESVIGFHGAGGGGSMMSMDALLAEGFRIANFCDTSGNPPASKVYRAAKIILSQPGIDGYFASGSGVASQEQVHSARGLVKAFREVGLDIPAVIRLGGNMEDEAVEILYYFTQDLSTPVEGYKRDDPASFCAKRLRALVDGHHPFKIKEEPKSAMFPEKPYQFRTVTKGTVVFDHALCVQCESKICVEACGPNILKLEEGLPVLAISQEEAAKGKCTECLACEQECLRYGKDAAQITLPIPGLD